MGDVPRMTFDEIKEIVAVKQGSPVQMSKSKFDKAAGQFQNETLYLRLYVPDFKRSLVWTLMV